jgi:amino acid transporter
MVCSAACNCDMVRLLKMRRGFAIGWDYAIQWLTILPFEITAAGFTIDFWKHYNIGASLLDL